MDFLYIELHLATVLTRVNSFLLLCELLKSSVIVGGGGLKMVGRSMMGRISYSFFTGSGDISLEL